MNETRYISLSDLIAGGYCGGVTLVLRHAERHPINRPQDALTADLTENGFAQAEDFGRALSGVCDLRQVFASPIPRCINTATRIVAGAGLNLPIGRKWWLFSPWLEVERVRGRNGAAGRMKYPAHRPDFC